MTFQSALLMKIAKKRDKNVKTLHNILSKHVVEIQVEMMKRRPWNQGCKQSLKSARLSVLRKEFVAGGCTPYLQNYMKSRSFIHNRQELRNKGRRIFASDKFWPSKKIENSLCRLTEMGRRLCALCSKSVAVVQAGHPHR